MDNSFVMTFDADWAPDYIIEDLVELLNEYRVKGTLFCTDYFPNPSQYLETGIHPNFMSDSTQGDTVDAVIQNLLERASCRCVRTHRFFWYSDLLNIFAKYKILVDSSLYLPLQQYLQPSRYKEIYRIPVWWSDNLHLEKEFTDIRSIDNFYSHGLKVLDFHPINIFYNTASIKMRSHIYEDHKKNALVNNKSFYNRNRLGIRDIFISFCNFINDFQLSSFFLSDFPLKTTSLYRQSPE